MTIWNTWQKSERRKTEKAIKMNSEEAWDAYRECASMMRLLVNKRKRAQYQQYINNLEEKDGAKAIETDIKDGKGS